VLNLLLLQPLRIRSSDLFQFRSNVLNLQRISRDQKLLVINASASYSEGPESRRLAIPTCFIIIFLCVFRRMLG
jgi:hypothetical protein